MIAGQAGQHEMIAGQHAVTAGRDEMISGQHKVIAGQHEIIAGQHEEIAGQHAVMAGQHAVIAGPAGPVSSDYVVVTLPSLPSPHLLLHTSLQHLQWNNNSAHITSAAPMEQQFCTHHFSNSNGTTQPENI